MTPKEFFGESHDAWRAALDALHEFAKADKAPLGCSVVEHFQKRLLEADKAIGASRAGMKP